MNRKAIAFFLYVMDNFFVVTKQQRRGDDKDADHPGSGYVSTQ